MPQIQNLPRIQRVFVQQQSSGLLTINNTSGTWNNAGAKFIRVPENALTLKADDPLTPIPYLTGTRSDQPGIIGRHGGSWSLNGMPVIPSGSLGTVPDMTYLIEAVFGQPPTVNAGVSVVYNFTDAAPTPLTFLKFPHNQTTLSADIGFGAIVTRAVFTFNQNVFTCDFSGALVYEYLKDQFSVITDGVGLGGLTVFPVEPSSPTTVGNFIPGFGGTFLIDGFSEECQITGMQFTVDTGNAFGPFVFCSAYPSQIVGGKRQVALNSMTFLDSDNAGLTDLKQKAKTKATISGTATVGLVAGSKVQFALAGIQMGGCTLQDSGTYVNAVFDPSIAHATSIANTDDAVMTLL